MTFEILYIHKPDETDEMYRPHEYSQKKRTSGQFTPKKDVKKKLLSAGVLTSLDRGAVSDRPATMVLGAAAQALGHSLDDVTLSRSSVRRARMESGFSWSSMEE